MDEQKFKSPGLFDPVIAKAALVEALKNFNPASQFRNPVMFIVGIGALLSTYSLVREILSHHAAGFTLQITIWLWITLFFANFAEAMAKSRSRAQATSLRRTVTGLIAKKILHYKKGMLPDANTTLGIVEFTEKASAEEIIKDDVVLCVAGDTIPGDGEVIEGIASVDESAITGESAPVIRESGGDRSAVTGGTRILSDAIIVRITRDREDSFINRMITLVEGAARRKTPNEIALTLLLSSLTLIFLLVVATLPALCIYLERTTGQNGAILLSLPVLISLLVCLIPTTIGGLLSAIGISGMDRLLKRKVIALSGRAIEAAGDVDVLLLDKTGTITIGNRMASQFIPAPGFSMEQVADAAQLASLADETPEGRSIVVLAKQKFGIRGRGVAEVHAHFIPFSARTKMSGVDIKPLSGAIRSIRKGAHEAIRGYVEDAGENVPQEVHVVVEQIAKSGGTPLVVAENGKVLGVVHLKDIIKGGIRERFDHMRKMGIKTIMITGDNALTAAAIAAEAGVDDFIANASPESKLERIRQEQRQGRMIAMIGDGTNDAPALAQADIGVAMNSGTQAAREAGNMIDLESNPTKLIEIVEIGKQLLMTRGALTTFSIANDVSKYFAIIPAMFGGLYAADALPGPLSALNIMKLSSPQSAILSAVIFNALIIAALIPLALKGAAFRPAKASEILLKNLLIYGVGGLIIPFIGIKLIDMLITAIGLV
jgi:K+-transporting ATPase ATPase B chain